VTEETSDSLGAGVPIRTSRIRWRRPIPQLEVKTLKRALSCLGPWLAVGLALAACTSSTTASIKSSAPTGSPSSRAVAVAARRPWPQHAPVVGTITALEPPADNVLLFKPILLAAYKKACSDVVSVESAIRALGPRSRLILVRCQDEPIRAVRLVFTGVIVPNLHAVLGNVGMAPEPQSLLAMLGLHWHITRRSAAGQEPGTLVEQEPAPGVAVPFGTTIRVVIAR
jgi:hypothetical protein